MGLSGRKVKQRIPNDPRNLSWADDANKFGAAYLQKLGWSSGTGLGASGEGRTSHIKVHQKLDMFGIGAAHQKDPNGLAWKQNRDFENLLRRLNAGGEASEEGPGTKVDGFARATEEKPDESKKRKRDAEDEGEEAKSESEVEETKEERKKRKKEEKARKREEKEKKKAEKKKAKETEGNAEEEKATTPESPAEPPKPRPVVARPVRAHRARFMASKNIASKSSSAIDEILGISRSGSATPYPSTLDTPSEPSSSATPADDLKMQELTTSSKSVMDYFKEKLLAKSNAASSSSSPAASSSTSTPQEEYDGYDDRPRGLGSGLGFRVAGGIGASRLRSEITVEAEEHEERPRAGLGSFASRLSAMFSAATENVGAGETVTESVKVEVVEEVVEKRKEKKDKGKKREEADEDAAEAETKKDKKSKKRKERVEEAAIAEVSEKKEKKKSKRKPSEDENPEAEPEASESAPAVKEKKDKKSKKDRKKEIAESVEDPADVATEKKKKKSKKSKSSES